MPVIKTPFGMSRPANSHVLTLEFDVHFTEFERKENLQCWIRAALYDRDGSPDKVFFWTNGRQTTVHSTPQLASDAKDDFIGFFPSVAIRPNDPRVTNGVFHYSGGIDLDNPALRDRLIQADDPLPDPPFLGRERWEELNAYVHAYNELAPSTALSREEGQTDVDPR